MPDSAVLLGGAMESVKRGAVEMIYESLALEPRKSSSKKKKPKKIKLANGGTVENWKLALIIIGSILAACLLAYAIWWFYKRKQAKKNSEDEEGLKPEKHGPGEVDEDGDLGREYQDVRRDV